MGFRQERDPLQRNLRWEVGPGGDSRDWQLVPGALGRMTEAREGRGQSEGWRPARRLRVVRAICGLTHAVGFRDTQK